MSGGITAHGLLHGLVCGEVDRMCWTCRGCQSTATFHTCPPGRVDLPAPTITLDNPLHNDRYPSTLDMVVIALPMPLYTAAGVGLTICIRVCDNDQWTPLASAPPRSYTVPSADLLGTSPNVPDTVLAICVPVDPS